MDKQTIAGIILLIVWILLMLIFSPKIFPDFSTDNYEEKQCQDFGEGKGCW
jgi:hypothetical protein